MNSTIQKSIEKASKVIGSTWPLYTFVASNPLSGYENTSFSAAVNVAKEHFHAEAYPSAAIYRKAYENGQIDMDILQAMLRESGLDEIPEHSLTLLEKASKLEIVNPTNKVDRIMSKWLSSFMDEGLAEWEMPYKSEGFYTAWRLLVPYDSCIGSTTLSEIPKTSEEALEILLKGYNEKEYDTIFTHHLAALPGWTGYINHRTTSNSEWQEEYPISLSDYLAARLWTCKKLNIAMVPEKKQALTEDHKVPKIQHIWLRAWERTWQEQLTQTLQSNAIASTSANGSEKLDAQFVFCIDTRSELIRRHVEQSGNYETFGYAGFFGIAMDYENLHDGITRKSCPPIVSSSYVVSEKAKQQKEQKFKTLEKRNRLNKFGDYFLKRMKNMLPSAFGFVEGTGFYYGLSLLARTLMPEFLYRNEQRDEAKIEAICEPSIQKVLFDDILQNSLPLEEKVAIVKSAFDLMGWEHFAPLVIFAGHGSHSANNPFGSSLDCGACAASPGRHNARVLAQLANDSEVRKMLKKTYHINIPTNTYFVGAEHNTTTDTIILFDADAPERCKQSLAVVKRNLATAQRTATQDRLETRSRSVSKAQRKANNWAETRPEWGLAKNAGFIVGPRDLTKNTNLDSRCFLHSYNWKQDTTGKALEGIMQGPMVVTQWINNHYYFSTVDNDIYGGGSKITHNITGKFGVVQGNGGDLKMGLPLQSLFNTDDSMYHQPLRLSVLIQAPISRVSEILARNENLKTLLDNEWIYLLVMDPNQKNHIMRYNKSIQWVSVSSNDSKSAETPVYEEELAPSHTVS